MNSNGITEGVIWKQIISFFFPILLGTFFQQLYNTADAIIVGQFLGKEALAAVGGGTGTAINLLIGFFTGLSSGATVVISQHFGAKNEERVEKAIHTAIALALVGGLIISVLGYVFTVPLLDVIGTPDDVMPLAVSYMHIYFLGGIPVVMYNMGAGIFRAMGDSRSPFYFLLASCMTNIVLDILFVGFFHTGVEGAAIATVISQLLSMVLIFITLMRRKDSAKLRIRKIAFDRRLLTQMLMIGFPAGIQSIMYTISNLIIQAAINQFGTDTAAAWAGWSKLDQIFWMFINAFSISITTFVGQNYGAGKIDRAKKGVRTVTLMAAVSTFVIEAGYFLVGRYGLMLFITDSAVLEIGVEIMRFIVPWYITYIAIEILSGAIRGAGKSMIPTIISVVGICILRIVWIYIVPLFDTSIIGVLFSYPFSWILTSILFIIYYFKGNIYSVASNQKRLR
ncbi:MAG: MATE family efflux transporter [Spirochaetes bacterium]|uniref:MATE family efflux transporter n=1 Tax=Candidatus Ornithospirochaeta stercoripullorum TaxID=2840899 RepID=A0A9D9H4U8_9SPIO|nr:MATE family efflux transporter [Candidatus Ornithospirochaeta stercoripullorum]